MEITENIKEITDKLCSNKLLGPDELKKIERWLENSYSQQEAETWLRANWESSANVITDLSFDEIRRRIKQNNERRRKQNVQHLVRQVQRIAAVLLIPMLILTSWLIFHHLPDPAQWLALTTKPGERTHVVLPDGSEVWINVDSRLEYPTTFNQDNRSLKLDGEAYFKVAKGKELPFVVNTKDFEVMATGTEFNISAYPDDAHASTFLKEGTVKFTYSRGNSPVQTFEMKPGEQVVVDSKRNSLDLRASSSSNSVNWRNGELLFENEPMDVVFKKMERWYDVTIHFNPLDFTGETLAVNLKDKESIERLLEIMDNAIGIEFRKTGNEYWITKTK